MAFRIGPVSRPAPFHPGGFVAKLTPNQITAACYAAWKEPDAPSAARKIGLRLLEEVLSQEENFSSAAERRATEAEVAMDELDNYAPPANPAEDDANLFTGEGDE